MKAEDLTLENIGREVLIDAIGQFTDCRATFRAWEKNQKKVIVSLDAPCGKAFQPGRLLEIQIENVRFAPPSPSATTDRVTPMPGLAGK